MIDPYILHPRAVCSVQQRKTQMSKLLSKKLITGWNWLRGCLPTIAFEAEVVMNNKHDYVWMRSAWDLVQISIVIRLLTLDCIPPDFCPKSVNSGQVTWL